MKILLSVRPVYAQAILDGHKQVEFRKTRIARPVSEGYIYMTQTKKCIVAHISIGDIIEASPADLWLQFQSVAGIDREGFFSYFLGKEKGYAIIIDSVKKLPETEQLKPRYVPQSFCYI